MVQLQPQPWQSVEEGHLAKLLIPRHCESHLRIRLLTVQLDPITSMYSCLKVVHWADRGSTLVQKYISSVFKHLGWHEEQVRTFSDS